MREPEISKVVYNIVKCLPTEAFDDALCDIVYDTTINGRNISLTYYWWCDGYSYWKTGDMCFCCQGFDFDELNHVIKTFLDAGNDFDNVVNKNWDEPLYTELRGM